MPKKKPRRAAKDPETQETLRQLRSLTHTLDNAFEIPILGYRVGWDAIIGLIPGVGDAIMLVPSGVHRLPSVSPRRT